MNGAIPHLIKALPHRLGFIASKIKKEDEIGDPAFDDIITGLRTLKQLNHVELIRFLRDFHNNNNVKDCLNLSIFNNYMRTINTWITTYDNKYANDVKKAEEYLESKKDKIYDLFIKTLLPQLMGGIARKQV